MLYALTDGPASLLEGTLPVLALLAAGCWLVCRANRKQTQQ